MLWRRARREPHNLMLDPKCEVDSNAGVDHAPVVAPVMLCLDGALRLTCTHGPPRESVLAPGTVPSTLLAFLSLVSSGLQPV